MQCSNIYNTSFGLQSECKGCGMIIFIFVSPGFTQNNYTKYYTIQKFPTIWYKDVYYNNVIIPFLTVDVKTFPICLLVTTQEEDGDYRVFYVNSYSGIARRIICEVSKMPCANNVLKHVSY